MGHLANKTLGPPFEAVWGLDKIKRAAIVSIAALLVIGILFTLFQPFGWLACHYQIK